MFNTAFNDPWRAAKAAKDEDKAEQDYFKREYDNR